MGFSRLVVFKFYRRETSQMEGNAVKINRNIFSCALFRHTFYAFFAKFFLSELKPFAAFVILHVIHSDHVFYHLLSHNFVLRCYFQASVFLRKKPITIYWK